MIYYVGNIALMLVLFFLTERNTALRDGRKLFCILASLQWITFVGLRNYEVFSDNLLYQSRYGRDAILSLQSILPSEPTLSGGWGYDLLSKICLYLGFDFRLFLFVLAALYIGSLGVMIYKLSSDTFTSFLVFATLMIFTALCPLRQSVAVAFAGVIGYKFARDRKPVQFALCIIVGMALHMSAIVAVPIYFLGALRWLTDKPLVFALVILIEFGFVFLAPGASRDLVNLVSGEDYSYYASHDYVGANTVLFMAMYYLLYALCVMRRASFDATGWDGLSALMLICMILPFALINSNVVRLTYYYMPLVAILMPAFFRSFDKAWGTVFKLGFFAAFVVAGVVFTAARAGMADYVPVLLIG